MGRIIIVKKKTVRQHHITADMRFGTQEKNIKKQFIWVDEMDINAAMWIYSSILQGLLALIAIVGIFISLVIQPKIQHANDALNPIILENWNEIVPNKSQKKIDNIFNMYKRRYEIAKPSIKMKISIWGAYLGCATTCFVSLLYMLCIAIIGTSNHSVSIGNQIEQSLYIIAFLTIAIVIFIGYLLYEILNPGSGVVFRLDSPDEVKSANYLCKKLSSDPISIIEKFGLIRISGVMSQDHLYVEFCNHLLPRMAYKVMLKSKNRELDIQTGTLGKNIWTNLEVEGKKFLDIVKNSSEWQLWIEIHSLPSNFANFNEVRYVFVPEIEPNYSISQKTYVNFLQKAVAYKFPEWKVGDMVIPESWMWSTKEWPHLYYGEPGFIKKLHGK